uniref:Uncharacterized protein n=1 Tax=Anas zonorhyncha TaxID=75864 RepID=A0A8B9UTR4_9AVES
TGYRSCFPMGLTTGRRGLLLQLLEHLSPSSSTDLGHPTPQHPTPQHPTPQRPTPQHPTPQHPTPQHPTPQHPTPQHPTPQRPTLWIPTGLRGWLQHPRAGPFMWLPISCTPEPSFPEGPALSPGWGPTSRSSSPTSDLTLTVPTKPYP